MPKCLKRQYHEKFSEVHWEKVLTCYSCFLFSMSYLSECQVRNECFMSTTSWVHKILTKMRHASQFKTWLCIAYASTEENVLSRSSDTWTVFKCHFCNTCALLKHFFFWHYSNSIKSYWSALEKDQMFTLNRMRIIWLCSMYVCMYKHESLNSWM